MARRSSAILGRTICNRCFGYSQASAPVKRFCSNNSNETHTNSRSLHDNLWDTYAKRKSLIEAQPLPADRDPSAIYANNELDLQEVEVFGFDYDYTLASYTPALHYLIYNLGREVLVTDHKYPQDIMKIDYDPKFAIRGLHCDVRKGLLLKIDAFHNIQLGAVFRGTKRLSKDEVIDIYNGTHVAIDNMSSFYGKGPNMYQLMDLFAVPEVTLFSNVIQYFIENNIPYDPEYVFYDVRVAVQGLHNSGRLHQEIMRNIAVFLEKDSAVPHLLQHLLRAGKKLFLITNSGVGFVDAGMKYLVGTDWMDMFDVVITNARKPKFFYDSRPFRSVAPGSDHKSWDKVCELSKGKFYHEGNLFQFREFTGWYGSKVLYFGDHVYSDLADAALKHGWRTAAIIPELETEVKIINSDMYKRSVCWLVALEDLISEVQKNPNPEAQAAVQEWLKERSELRVVVKKVFNPQFGSVFRTYHNASYFSRRLNRFADVYMSSVENLLHYPLSYTFYPRRTALPHEVEIHAPSTH